MAKVADRAAEQTAQNDALAASRVPLCRCVDDAMLDGVCAGIARRLDADPILVRVTALVLAVCTCGLVCFAYVYCALTWPAAEGDAVVEVDPLSVESAKYRNVVNSKRSQSRSDHAARADGGHVPPTPPDGAKSMRRAVPVPLPTGGREASRSAQLAVLVVACALTVLFCLLAFSLVRYVPTATVLGFWPLALVVAGIVLVASPTRRFSLAARLFFLAFCIELCVALLPFTLEIIQPAMLRRLSVLSVALFITMVLCVAVGIASKRSEMFLFAVVFFGLVLFSSWIDIGTLTRISIMQSDPRLAGIFPLLRG